MIYGLWVVGCVFAVVVEKKACARVRLAWRGKQARLARDEKEVVLPALNPQENLADDRERVRLPPAVSFSSVSR